MLGKGLIVSKLLANIVIMSVVAREYAVRDEPDLPEELPDSGEEAYYGETIEDLKISLEHYKTKLSQESEEHNVEISTIQSLTLKAQSVRMNHL